MDAGSKVDADQTGAGTARTSRSNATDDIRLKASPTGNPVGALITSNQILGSCPSSTNRGGNITINADSDKDVVGNLTMEPGTTTANGSRSPPPLRAAEARDHPHGSRTSTSTVTCCPRAPRARAAADRSPSTRSCNLIVTDLGSVVSKGETLAPTSCICRAAASSRSSVWLRRPVRAIARPCRPTSAIAAIARQAGQLEGLRRDLGR